MNLGQEGFSEVHVSSGDKPDSFSKLLREVSELTNFAAPKKLPGAQAATNLDDINAVQFEV
jgi:hypothetical protein